MDTTTKQITKTKRPIVKYLKREIGLMMRKTKMVKKKNSQGKRMETNCKNKLLFAKKILGVK